MTIFGTRPEAIKMAPLIKELELSKELKNTVVVTAQHREMLDQILNAFSIEPDYDLNVMSKGQTLSQITRRIMEGLEPVIQSERPDIILVHGDTTTTFVASLVAFYNQIKVGHVEAGLRTYNRYSPFPEEVNRQLTGVIADLHFAPTEISRENLLNEGKSNDHIFVTGNTVVDALGVTVNKENVTKTKSRRILLTIHRRENLGEHLTNVFAAIQEIVKVHTDVIIVYPMHKNPVIRKSAEEMLAGNERVELLEPLDVVDFHNEIAKSYLILTDSGGIQEEAPTFGVPVLVLRDTTERPEGIQAKTSKLIGTGRLDIVKEVKRLLENDKAYNEMSKAQNPYGDGKASQRIVKILEERL